MARLALAAMLLAALMPTVSRVLAASAPRGAPVLMEMCTVAGTKLIDVSSFLGVDDAEPAPATTAMADACGYCTLATPPPILLALLFLSLLWTPRAPATRVRTRVLKPLRNARGLGSQAPPIAL